MNDKNSRSQVILQALTSAEASLRLARQLLEEAGGGIIAGGQKTLPAPSPTRHLPGILGTFDGEYLTTPEGRKYPVPPNYASKSALVFGDTLKRVEQNGEVVIKQVERVKRKKITGLLVQKDGKYRVVTSDGSYRVLPAAVTHFEAKVGDEAVVVVPQENVHVPFAAIESVVVKNQPTAPLPPVVEKPVAEKSVGETTTSPVPAPVVPVGSKEGKKKAGKKNQAKTEEKGGEEKKSLVKDASSEALTKALPIEDELR